MSFTVQVLPEATEEVGVIFGYYENKKPGFGHRFQQALNSCYENLSLDPFRQKRKGIFRHAMIQKFPYRVVY